MRKIDMMNLVLVLCGVALIATAVVTIALVVTGKITIEQGRGIAKAMNPLWI